MTDADRSRLIELLTTSHMVATEVKMLLGGVTQRKHKIDQLHKAIGRFIGARRIAYEAGLLSPAVISAYADKHADMLRGGPKHEVIANEH